MVERAQQDVLLAPGEYMFVLDTTKGTVSVLVGPYQTGQSGNTTPVVWSGEKFERKDNYMEAVKRLVTIAEGEYAELTNASADVNKAHPMTGNSNGLVELNFGSRIMVPGPACFALWPRQSIKVIPGHQLRTNQYLVFRVYNDKEAIQNWGTATIKKAGEIVQPPIAPSPDASLTEASRASAQPEKFTVGQLIIMRGTEYSFVMPPTGIEVVPDKKGLCVREAVTLERMEYCILLGENGEKRFVKGPAVVFPSPTETFVEIDSVTKFKPVELNPHSGLYIKVVAEYQDESGSHKAGDELFISGQEMPIYYPRPEHSIISYGDKMIHYAVAVPSGEGRYVLDRDTGKVGLVKGPAMLLPDPRQQVLVRRVLDQRQVSLWYPGNEAAKQANLNLEHQQQRFSSDAETQISAPGVAFLADPTERGGRSSVEALKVGAVNRPSSFSKPRTVTLDTKFDGAVQINPYPGYAVLIINKSGERKVIEGPAAILLEYDETLVPLELSTGTPKTDAETIKTVYLQVQNNRVSDEMTVETKDLVRVTVRLACRINFEGEDKLRWFNVDNYVRFLTEHLRSLVRNAVKAKGIEEFYANPIPIIRDCILGVATGEGGKRPGRVFDENGMRVCEVDVLSVTIPDSNVSVMLQQAQTSALKSTIAVTTKERDLKDTKRMEAVTREINAEQAITQLSMISKEMEVKAKQAEHNAAEARADNAATQAALEAKQSAQPLMDAIAAAELARSKASKDQDLMFEKARIEQELEKLKGQTAEIVARANAVDDKFIAALQSFGDQALIEKAAQAMAPLSIFQNSGVLDSLAGLLHGTRFGAELKKLGSRNGEEIPHTVSRP